MRPRDQAKPALSLPACSTSLKIATRCNWSRHSIAYPIAISGVRWSASWKTLQALKPSLAKSCREGKCAPSQIIEGEVRTDRDADAQIPGVPELQPPGHGVGEVAAPGARSLSH